VDGEPWRLPRCELTLRHNGQAPVLQHVSKELLQVNGGGILEGRREAVFCKQIKKDGLNSRFSHAMRSGVEQYNEWLVGQGKLDAAGKDQLLQAFKRRLQVSQ